jgi:hypothetical protein
MTKPEAHVSAGEYVEQIRKMVSDLTVDVAYMEHPAWASTAPSTDEYLASALTLVKDLSDNLDALRTALENQ